MGYECTSGLLPPLRDVQLAAPAALCSQCGGELYRQEPLIQRNGHLLCARCAAERRGGRRRRAIEQEEECGR
ncbi:MAG: hypothetical protein KH028_02990 [Oscillospiraceae bacterium]|nr:hypothetical protein [Oscillospiraceae bacterium]